MGAQKTSEQQRDLKQELDEKERELKNCLTLADKHITTMTYTTTDITAPFLVPEMVERVAGMLNYFLVYLAGPERRKLKVKNPEKYGFNPREMLHQIVSIYLHLNADRDAGGAFAEAIARDGRSYKDEVFEATARLLRTFNSFGEHEIAGFEQLAETVRMIAARDAEEEEDMGEVPDDYLDPIMATLMKDPVLLPSGISIDRTTIMRHLLNEPIDPFNRQPLTAEMLKPNVELKDRIDAFVASS